MADPKKPAIDPISSFIGSAPYSEIGQYPSLSALDTLPDQGYEFDPMLRFTEGIASGSQTLASNIDGYRAMWHSINGNERKMEEALHSAGLRQVQGAGSQTIGSAEIFHQFLEAPTFGGFMEASMGFMGEMGPSAAATITTALAGSAIGALATGVAGTTALAGTAGASAVVGGKVVSGLAMKGYTRNKIKDAVKKSVAGDELTPDERDLMEAIYQNHRNTVFKRNVKVGGLSGAAAQEYPQGAGTFFKNFAEEGMTDPMSAWMSAGLGVPFTAIGLGSEAIVFKTVSNMMKKKQAQMSLLNPKPTNRSLLTNIATGTGISSASEGLAELGQQELEIQQQYAIDKTYTQEQARLDRMTALFAGAAGGAGIGGSLSSVASVVGKANELLHENQIKKAVNEMFILKMDGDPTGLVMREPVQWIKAQFAAMMDPEVTKDAVWVDANSVDELQKAIPELEKKYGPGAFQQIKLESAVGGYLYTTNSEKAESFINTFSLNTPSQSLVEDALANVLDYPRGRIATDEYVVEVKDKDGNLVHYHQTGNPNKEGNEHLEAAKNLFNNSPNYTYEIVEGETHITERAKLVTPFDYETLQAAQEEAMDTDLEEAADPVLLARYKGLVAKAQQVGGIENLSPEEQQTLRLDFQALQSPDGQEQENATGQLQTELESVKEGVETKQDDALNDGVLPNMQEVNLYNAQEIKVDTSEDLGSDTNPFLGKGKKPWAVPSGKYTNEYPTPEQVDDVLDLYPPGHPFRDEFLNKLNQKQLSKSVVTALIKLSSQEITNNNESLRIEENTQGTGKTETAFQITKYRVPIDSPMELGYNPEIGRIIRSTVDTKSPPLPRWSVSNRNTNSPGQVVHMPMLINKIQTYLVRTGLAPASGYGTQLQDAIVTLYEMLEQENSEFELLYDQQPVTPTVLQNELIYQKGKKGDAPVFFTFAQLTELNSEAATEPKKVTIKEVAAKATELEDLNAKIEDLQNKIAIAETEINGSPNYDALMPAIDELYGPKQENGGKRNGPENLLMQKAKLEYELADLKEKSRGELQTVYDPSEQQNQEPDAELSPDARWDAEYDSWVKQPLSKNTKVGTYSPKTGNPKKKYPSARPLPPIIKKDTTIEMSQDINSHFGENTEFIKTIVDTARKVLGIKKPILVFSTSETIDLGHDGMNQRVQDVQKEVQEKQGRKAKNIPMQDYDVVILDTNDSMAADIKGLFLATLGHEIGHSFLREQLASTLTDPKVRTQLQKMYEKDIAANPTISAWQGSKGFDEWFADKVSSVLFDLDKGVIYKATNAASAFIKKITTKIKAFYDGLANRTKQAGASAKAATDIEQRFAYNENFAQYIQGVNNVQIESTQEQNVQEPGYQERAQMEAMIESVFGPDKTGHKAVQKAQNMANKILTTGKLPKGFRKIFETAHRHMERLGANKGTGLKIANFFHKLSGASGVPGMINEANRLANELGNELLTLLGEETYTETVVDSLIEAQDETKDTKDLSKNGQIVREFIDSLHERFDLGSLNIVKRPNFFPRIIAINAIAHDATKRQKLIELLVERNPGNTEEEATAVVDHLISKNVNSLEDTTDTEEEFDVAVLKSRVLMFEALDTKTLVDEGLAETADIAFFEYIRKTTRRVEFEKRGGSARLEELVNELPAEERNIAREAIDAMLGRISPIQNNLWKQATNYGLLINVVTLLSMAVFASVPDAAGPILRARELDMSSIAKNLYAALTKKEAAEFTKSVGANAVESITTSALNAGEVDTMLPDSKKWTDRWFRFTQLERWTRFTRVFAAGMGRDFILKHSKNVKEGVPNSESVLTSMRYLEDLGLTAAEVDAWNGADIAAHPKIKTAVGRFVDEAIVRPNAAERPLWASDPHYALVWQLKSFYYAYGKNIIGGLFREGKARYGETGNIPAAAVPLILGAATLLPLTMLGWDLRERFKIGLSWLLPGISPNDPGVDYRHTQSMAQGEYWFELLDRSGALGAYALAIPLLMEDKRYGKPFFIPILGPSAEKSWDLATGGFDPTDYMPGYSQLNSNALTFKQ